MPGLEGEVIRGLLAGIHCRESTQRQVYLPISGRVCMEFYLELSAGLLISADRMSATNLQIWSIRHYFPILFVCQGLYSDGVSSYSMSNPSGMLTYTSWRC